MLKKVCLLNGMLSLLIMVIRCSCRAKVGITLEWAGVSCSIQQSSCYTCYTEDSCRPAIIDSCQKQLSQISFHAIVVCWGG